MLPVKLITFDVTGTLLYFRTPVLEKYVEIGSKFGVKTDPKTLKRNFNEAWKTLNEQHPNFGKQTGLGWKNWWQHFVEKTFVGYIKPEEKYKISEIVNVLIDFHTTREAFELLPGTSDLLEYLKTKPVQLGVISNYDPRLNQILEFMDLKKYFNFVLISYEFGYPKPDVRIFQEALRLGGCASGDEAVHIGDDMFTDYVGAKAAGLRAALISSGEKDLNNSQVQGTEVFKDLNDLKTFFQSQSRFVWKKILSVQPTPRQQLKVLTTYLRDGRIDNLPKNHHVHSCPA